MLKTFNPIIVVAGEPKSVFLELFFKSFKKFKDIPIVLIANEKLLIDHLKLLKIKRPIRNLDSHKKINYKILDYKKINLINVPLKYNSLKNTVASVKINPCQQVTLSAGKESTSFKIHDHFKLDNEDKMRACTFYKRFRMEKTQDQNIKESV